MVVTFFAFAGLLTLYLLTFIAYFLALIIQLVTGRADNLSSIPLGGQILFLKTLGPFTLLLLLPASVLVALALFVFFSFRRWGRRELPLRYDKIANPRISVVLTAYDDAESIPGAVKDFREAGHVQRVIVVDNNSSDETGARALEAGAVVHKETKQGYGYACISGLKKALEFSDSNIIALCEGDGTFRAYDLEKMLPYLDNVDMVVGSRTTQELLDRSSQLDWFHIWGNLFLAKLVQVKFWDMKHWGRVRLTDVGCTFRLIRREALTKIDGSLHVGQDHFSPHMIMVAIAKGLKVIEVPITFRERVGRSKGAGSGKMRATKIGLRMLWHILAY